MMKTTISAVLLGLLLVLVGACSGTETEEPADTDTGAAVQPMDDMTPIEDHASSSPPAAGLQTVSLKVEGMT